MRFKGSCYCGKVAFEGGTDCTCPIQRCYCKTCRKCNGSPLSTYVHCYKDKLTITKGKDEITTYRVKTADRQFCSHCGSTLFFIDDRWPDNIFPAASAFDTPLETSDKYVHIFVKDKADWFSINTPGPHFDEYSEKTSLEWHREFGLIHRDNRIP